MTEELSMKYNRIAELALEESSAERAELMKEVLMEEVEAFNRNFGGGNIIRLHVICAMCDVMADSVRGTLKRWANGKDVEYGITMIKRTMGVISNG